MTITRLQAALALSATCALAASLAWQVRENAHLRAAAARQSAADTVRVIAIEKQIAVQTQRVATAEAKVSALLKTAKQAASVRMTPPSAGTTGKRSDPIDGVEVAKAAITRAKASIDGGKLREALEEYVTCYRELQAVRPGGPGCQRLMSAMQQLARTFPEARAALAGLRDAAMAQRLTEPGRRELVFEIALLNQRLGEGHRTLALYDSLPPDDMNRHSLAMIALDTFIEARRYHDALLGRSFGQMLNWIESGVEALPKQPVDRQPAMHNGIVQATATHIEVLTGAGKTAEARTLTERLLAFDGSDATRAILQRHLDRAQAPKP